MRTAIEADQLRLHYQPIIFMGTGTIVGVEALLRWRHPVHGEIRPRNSFPSPKILAFFPRWGMGPR